MTAPMANGRKPRTGPKALLLATGAATLFFLGDFLVKTVFK